MAGAGFNAAESGSVASNFDPHQHQQQQQHYHQQHQRSGLGSSSAAATVYGGERTTNGYNMYSGIGGTNGITESGGSVIGPNGSVQERMSLGAVYGSAPPAGFVNGGASTARVGANDRLGLPAHLPALPSTGGPSALFSTDYQAQSGGAPAGRHAPPVYATYRGFPTAEGQLAQQQQQFQQPGPSMGGAWQSQQPQGQVPPSVRQQTSGELVGESTGQSSSQVEQKRGTKRGGLSSGSQAQAQAEGGKGKGKGRRSESATAVREKVQDGEEEEDEEEEDEDEEAGGTTTGAEQRPRGKRRKRANMSCTQCKVSSKRPTLVEAPDTRRQR